MQAIQLIKSPPNCATRKDKGIYPKPNLKTSSNQRSEKCVRCVLLLYNGNLRVFLADHLLQAWSQPRTFKIHNKAAKLILSGIGSIPHDIEAKSMSKMAAKA